MWRHIASNTLTVFIVGGFLGGGVIAWGAAQYKEPGPLDQAMCLRVEPGSNMRRVGDDLAGQGAISSTTMFRMGADYADKTTQLKAGSFLIEAGASMEQIVDAITVGGQSTCGTEVVYRVGVTRTTIQVRELDPETNRYVELVAFNPVEEATPEAYDAVKSEIDTRFRASIAEGVTSWQVVNALNEMEFLEQDVSNIPPEGSLAPDSYEFSPGDSVVSILDRMAQRQARVLSEAWEARAPGVPLASPEDALILASIVEKETGVPEERRQVASVFVNRLNQGMKLQTDPTVIYGITQGQGVLGRGLRQSELRRETPWNTYVIPALPPTPIANPGRASIEAALNPDSTEFIFFVADGTGGHAFATNLDDHNANVARWREIEAERANSDSN
ncbi:MAG: endolytic transglycosylase MltG [Pseudomonadota bacterium]